jgi:hypothetical protein
MITIPKPKRVAKAGALRSVRLDNVSLTRLALCERIANESIGVKSTASTVVRRALALLECHYESLLDPSNKNPRVTTALKELEVMHLNIANAGRDPYGISVQNIKEAPVLKSIADLAKEKAVDKPRLLEEASRDIHRWIRGKA